MDTKKRTLVIPGVAPALDTKKRVTVIPAPNESVMKRTTVVPLSRRGIIDSALGR